MSSIMRAQSGLTGRSTGRDVIRGSSRELKAAGPRCSGSDVPAVMPYRLLGRKTHVLSARAASFFALRRHSFRLSGSPAPMEGFLPKDALGELTLSGRCRTRMTARVFLAVGRSPSPTSFDMNWGAFDLNLLIVFDAVMQERSVTRAGGRIGLSQPAVSHALGRLRHMLKDELFIRTPEGMIPTPRAAQLAEPLRRALNDMQIALEPEVFKPLEADRQFVIALNNYATVLLAPPLLMAVAAAAPGVRLDLRPAGQRDMAAPLDRGEIDLAIGTFNAIGERFASATLLQDSFVVVMRRDHPAARRELTPRVLARLAYLEISSSGEESGFVDDWLASHGLARKIAHRAPRLSAAAILSGSDLIAVLSNRLAQHWVQLYGLRARELPFVSPRIRIELLWHRRLDSQPAHLWLRQMIRQTATAHEAA